MKLRKRLLSLLLCGVMILSPWPRQVYAESTEPVTYTVEEIPSTEMQTEEGDTVRNDGEDQGEEANKEESNTGEESGMESQTGEETDTEGDGGEETSEEAPTGEEISEAEPDGESPGEGTSEEEGTVPAESAEESSEETSEESLEEETEDVDGAEEEENGAGTVSGNQVAEEDGSVSGNQVSEGELTVSQNAPAVQATSRATEGSCGENVTWRFENNKLYLSGDGEVDSYSADGAPWADVRESITEIEIGEGITKIGDSAFYGCIALTNVTLPGSLNTIGDYSFAQCTALEGVTLASKSLETIGINAFNGCSGLKKLTITSGVQTLHDSILNRMGWEQLEVNFGEGARFEYQGDTGITLAGIALYPGMTYIAQEDGSLKAEGVGGEYGDGVQWFMTPDGELVLSGSGTMPDPGEMGNMGEIPWNSYREVITAIRIGAGIKGVKSLHFALCPNLESIEVEEGNSDCCVENGVLFNADKTVLLIFPCGKQDESYSVPESVLEIGDAAFACAGIKTVALPEGLTEIGEAAFGMCPNLQEIKIPDKVTEIPMQAFVACQNLERIELPEGLQTIGDMAFGSCLKLSEIEIPDSVKSIGNSVFAGCGLQSANVPAGMSAVPEGLFAYCEALSSIEIPEGVTQIGGRAFYGCALTEVVLPATMNKIEEYAFGGCETLTSIRLESTNLSDTDRDAFDDCTALNTIIVGKTAKTLYNSFFAAIATARGNLENLTLTFEGENQFTYVGESLTIGELVLLEGITYKVDENGKIEADMSGTCGENVQWELDDTGKLIISGSGPMDDFSSYASTPPWYSLRDRITSVEVRDGVTSVGKYAFFGCQYVASTELADSITNIGAYSFYQNYSLSSIEMPERLESIGSSAFYSSGLTSVSIPDRVSQIGTSAFSGCEKLTSAVLPGGITEIPRYLFSDCTALRIVKIPNGVTKIGMEAFEDCSSLDGVELPETLTALEEDSFWGCSALTEIVIPDKVTEIENNAFRGCVSLEEIVLGAGVESVGSYAFSDSKNLKKVTLRSAAEINSTAFRNSSSIETVAIDARTLTELAYENLYYLTYGWSSGERNQITLEFLGPGQFTYTGSRFVAKNCALSQGSYEVDEQGRLKIGGSCEDGLSWTLDFDGTLIVTGDGEMEDYSTYNRPDWYSSRALVKKVVVEGNITHIGNYAFSGLENMTEASIPETVTSLGNYAFQECKQMNEFVIPAKVSEIGSYAFANCEALREIAVPEGIKEIERYTFSGCSDLEALTLPESLVGIGERAFSDCDGLTDIVIPQKVEDIGNYAFAYCDGIETVTLQAESLRARNLGSYIFYKSKTPGEIIVDKTVKDLYKYALSMMNPSETETKLTFRGENSFTYYDGSITIGGQALSEGDYMVDENGKLLRGGEVNEGVFWKLDGGILTIYGEGEMKNFSTTYYGRSPWYGFSDEIKSIVVENGITGIGNNCFRECPNLTKVALPDTLTDIGWGAFESCSGLERIEIPEGVTALESSTFWGCGKLEEIGLPESLVRIGSSVFRGCTSLKSIEFPEKLEEIGNSAFSKCSALERISIPAGVTEIGNDAFEECDSLAQLEFAEDAVLESIGNSAFAGAPIEELVLPDSLKSVGEWAFNGCLQLKRLDTGAGLQKIGQHAFGDCTLLETVTLGNSLKEMMRGSFDNCTALKTLILKAKDIESIHSGSVFEESTIERLTVSADVDRLTYDFMSSLGTDFQGKTSLLKDMVLEGPNEFVYEGKDLLVHTSGGDILLTEKYSPYLVNEKGELVRRGTCGENLTWRLEGGRLEISGSGEMYDYSAQNPAPWADFREKIEEIAIGDSVTGIGDYAFAECDNIGKAVIGNAVTDIGGHAFANCDNLEAVTMPENLQHLGEGAFEYCEKLSSINGIKKLAVILENWKAAGANAATFFRTALFESYVKEVESAGSSLSVVDSTGRTIAVNIPGNREVKTGMSITSNVTISGGKSDSEDIVRIYFKFDSEDGKLSLKGDASFGDISVSFRESELPDIYYAEVQETKAGATLNFNIDATYSNYTAGGDAFIWLSVLSQEEAAQLGDGVVLPQQTIRMTWETQPDEFEVTKTSDGTATLTGDGTENGQITVNGLKFTVSLEHKGETSLYGKDVMKSAQFTDTLTLPEGFFWREGLIEAVKAGDWSVGTSNTGSHIDVTIAGEAYELFEITQKSYQKKEYKLRLQVDEEERLQVCWDYVNPSTQSEIPGLTLSYEVKDEMIAVNPKVLQSASGQAKIYEIRNTVEMIPEFSFAQDAEPLRAEASAEIVAGKADYTLTKKGPESVFMGYHEANFSIQLENTSGLPFADLDFVEDRLEDYWYITPGNMNEMLNDAYGKDLTITLENANLYQPFDIGRDLKDYDGLVKEDPGVAEKGVTIAFSWANDGSCILMKTKRATGKTDVTRIGTGEACSTIEEALNKIGYLVTEAVTYHCSWDQEGQTLYPGTRIFSIPASAKSSFMRLMQDQPWYILNNYLYAEKVKNTAVSHEIGGQKKEASVLTDIERDYTLTKRAYFGDTLLDGEESVDISEGDVIRYGIEVYSRRTPGPPDALPVVDRMRGPQALLVEKESNPGMGGRDFKEYTDSATKKEYYILSKAGTYQNVSIGNKTADKVIVSKGSEGLDTLICWSIGPKGSFTSGAGKFYYSAIVDYGLAPVAAQDYSFRNECWIGERPGHRLYDDAFFGGKRVEIQKNIVTNLQKGESITDSHDPSTDEVTGRITLEEGEQVTYRLDLKLLGQNPEKVGGSSLRDFLPLAEAGYWNDKTVQICYVPKGETALNISDKTETGWEIVADPKNPNQQIIEWSDDFTLTMNGDAYIYVQLTFPKGEQWQAYSHLFGSLDLKNTFRLDNMQDEVFHDIEAPAEGLLQKGVYLTGRANDDNINFYYVPSQEKDSLLYYINDEGNRGIVTYYIALYNSGDSRMYLSEIQDVMPEGFTYECLYRAGNSGYRVSNNDSYYNSLIAVGDSGTTVKYKKAGIQVTEGEGGLLAFALSGDGGNESLSYDADRGMYYLSSGEAVVVAYNCCTNGYEDTLDSAENVAAMPYFNYNGSECALNKAASVERENKGNKASNDGDRALYGNEQIGQWGMNTEGVADGTKWLSSKVTMQRGEIVPGIDKRASVSFAGYSDPLKWTVKAVNNGTAPIRGYTITDRMMAPYQFTGTVDCTVKFGASDAGTQGELFSFSGERKKDDQTVIIKDYDGEKSLEINGAPVHIISKLRGYGGYRGTQIAEMDVSLRRDENGRETLSIFFQAGQHELVVPEGGSVELTLTTKNIAQRYENTSYYNVCYLTPKQQFDQDDVTIGDYDLYQDKPSIVNNAGVAVSYGYSTSSLKSVTELEKNGTETANSANSDESQNYISLLEEDAAFRYTLSVENSGSAQGGGSGMDRFILLDNLPQKGDHISFYEDVPRHSDFQVDFAKNPQVSVEVDDQELNEEQYVLEFSGKTEFSREDRSGAETDGWTACEQVSDFSEMRSLRLQVKDESGELIPAGAKIEVSFTAVIRDGEDPEPLATAWNSFGYRYSLKDDNAELEASPDSVGVQIVGVPHLQKSLKDSEGRAFLAPRQETFRFLIYEGEAMTFADGSESVVAQTLEMGKRKYTLAELTVEEGQTSANPAVLKDTFVYSYQNGSFVRETEEWKWENGEPYTVLELPQGEDSIYVFGDINGRTGNTMTFTYNPLQNQEIVCTNIRNIWTLELTKKSEETAQLLGNAVFALYSPNEAEAMTDDAYENLKEVYDLKPDRTLEEGGKAWYLKEVRITEEENGKIFWAELTEDSYYLLELRAPEGYNLNENPGQIVNKPESGKGIVSQTVLNAPGYEMPETGGSGTWGYLLTGAFLSALSLAYMAWKNRRRRRAL